MCQNVSKNWCPQTVSKNWCPHHTYSRQLPRSSSACYQFSQFCHITLLHTHSLLYSSQKKMYYQRLFKNLKDHLFILAEIYNLECVTVHQYKKTMYSPAQSPPPIWRRSASISKSLSIGLWTELSDNTSQHLSTEINSS